VGDTASQGQHLDLDQTATAYYLESQAADGVAFMHSLVRNPYHKHTAELPPLSSSTPSLKTNT
jgi:hypothetical protein